MEDIVYHYCNATVFKEIITKKTLRFSDITKSNDSAEIRWITTYFDSIFSEEYQYAQRCNRFRKACMNEDFQSYYNKFKEAYFSQALIGKDKFFWFFASCFSLENDMLSQWRGYADDGHGFSIGFSREALENYRTQGFRLLSIRTDEVSYKRNKHETIVRKRFRKLFRESSKEYGTNCSDKTRVLRLFNDCFQGLIEDSVFIKNPFFKEENEWRMCVWAFNESGTISDVKLVKNGVPEYYMVEYYERNDNSVPYFDMKFDPSIVKNVTLGPKNQTNTIELESLLNSNGFDCEIKHSDGTYV